MERIFLRRRIGVLFCIVGFLTIISAFTIFILNPAAETSVPIANHHVLIIDPGHGGEDGGAVAADGTLEAELNLSIAQKLHGLASFCGVQTILTRTGDHIDYPTDAATISARKTADQKQRVALINNTPNGVLISIHQNKFDNSAYSGTQVFYSSNNDKSRVLAESIRNSVVSLLQNDNTRELKPANSDIYLLDNATVPAVIVECGFLSNDEERAKLLDSGYQSEMAYSIAMGVLEYIDQ